MTISITAHKKIADFQEELSALFPALKVEFFTSPYEVGKTLGSETMIFNRTKQMVEIAQKEIFGKSKSDFDVTPEMTVRAFEQKLWKQYALCVKVFRNESGSFVETSSTDTWSLAEQNTKGNRVPNAVPMSAPINV